MTGDDAGLTWRFGELPDRVEDAPPPRIPPTATGAEAAWLRLLVLHTPFRATEQENFLMLTTALRNLEETFLEHPELSGYYAECFRDEQSDAVTDRGGAGTDPSESAVRHAAMLQMQLMEDVFYALRLDRYANAPENRGWMNLFRRWGRSPAFNKQFSHLEATFTPNVGQFYRWYIRELDTIDRQPVPHRWDRDRMRYGTSVVPTDGEAQRSPSPASAPDRPILRPRGRVVPGVLLDSGILTVPPRVQETARGTSTDYEETL